MTAPPRTRAKPKLKRCEAIRRGRARGQRCTMGGRGRPTLCTAHRAIADEIGVPAVLAPPPPRPTVQTKLAKLRHELEATRAERDEERERADGNYASYERVKARYDAVKSALTHCVAVLEENGRLADGSDGAIAHARAAVAPGQTN